MPKRKRPTTPFDLDTFSTQLGSETDRGCGLLGGALLDDRLAALLVRRLLASNERREQLLGQEGPLGTFSARIKLARALAWVSENVANDLDTIRGIRNEFAHGFDQQLSFDDAWIAGQCTKLTTAKAYLDGLKDRIANPGRSLSADVFRGMLRAFDTPRWRYRLTVEFIAQYLNDVPASTPAYAGSDLVAEVRALSANIAFTIKASAIVESAANR